MIEPNESLNDQPDGLHAGRNRWERVDDPEDQVSLRDLAIVPLKRKRAVIGCAAFGLLAGILVVVTMTPRYRATATIELNEDKQSGVSALSDMASMAGGGADELKVKIEGWLEELPAYPHAKLLPGMGGGTKQTTRLIKCQCTECGYTVRTTSKWIDLGGAPICPVDEIPMEVA